MTVTRRNEDGVTAVVFGLCALLLFSLGAIAVDLGNTFARKRDVQAQADFAALSAGELLPATAASKPQILARVVSYLNKNQPQTDGSAQACFVTKNCVTATQMTDGNDANGEVHYGHYNSATASWVVNNNQLTVLAPPAQVNFGLANVMGHSKAMVQATATVGIVVPANGVMPMYAAAGCDYGQQTLTDPANGQVGLQASLNSPGDTLDLKLDSGATLTGSDPGLLPAQINVNSTGSLTITKGQAGKALNKVNYVGFFRDLNQDNPNGLPSFVPYAVPTTGKDGTGKSVTVAAGQIPAIVTQYPSLWFVRLSEHAYYPVPPALPTASTAYSQWTKANQALPLRVGDSIFARCTSSTGAKNDGNFGTLNLPRTDVNSADWLPANIAKGLQNDAPPNKLTLAIYPPGSPAPYPQTCSSAQSYSVISTTTGNPTLKENTNCAGTDTGLTANTSTKGLITGVNGTIPGRLADPAKPTTCGPVGGPTAPTPYAGIPLNNDTLACFLIPSTDKTLGDISTPGYAGPEVLDPLVYGSPRFFWVPVFNAQASHGTSSLYPIIDFRPAFLTDQPLTANKTNLPSPTATNGLLVNNNGITAMTIIFFNINALPANADGSRPRGPGEKIVHLIS